MDYVDRQGDAQYPRAESSVWLITERLETQVFRSPVISSSFGALFEVHSGLASGR